MSRDLKDAAYNELARMGKALANPLRLELIDVLSQAPRDVESLARATQRTVTSASQHLQILAGARLVTRERRGTRVIYSVADGVPSLLAVLERVGLRHLAELPAHRAAWLQGHPDVASISSEELRRLMKDQSAILLDVRPEAEFDYGHIEGARSVPMESLAQHIADLPRDREIVACCRGPWCTWADEAVVQLHAAGFRARRYEGRVGAGE